MTISNRSDTRQKWKTRDELFFLKNIGSFRKGLAGESVEELLNGYLAGASTRNDWGALDKQRCIRFAENKLKRLS